MPNLIEPESLRGRAVVVFDVLRATTTITAALAAGVRSIRIFGNISEAAAAANAATVRPILCGEVQCLAPPGFDLGNSPGQFTPAHAGKDIFLSTTNGTKALVAAKSASAIFAGAVVNASAVAAAVIATKLDVILLCAGTNGKLALEDIIGAGAVLSSLQCNGVSDSAIAARRLFESAKSDLPQLFRQTQGGRNILAVDLTADIEFAARLDCLNIVGRADPDSLIIRPV